MAGKIVENKKPSSVVNTLKWLVVVALVVLMVWGNGYYSAIEVFYRALAIAGIALVAIFVAVQTVQGKAFNQLRRDAMVELRRVVWPTRQETLQTTMIVVAFVVLVAITLFVMDWILNGLITGLIG